MLKEAIVIAGSEAHQQAQRLAELKFPDKTWGFAFAHALVQVAVMDDLLRTETLTQATIYSTPSAWSIKRTEHGWQVSWDTEARPAQPVAVRFT